VPKHQSNTVIRAFALRQEFSISSKVLIAQTKECIDRSRRLLFETKPMVNPWARNGIYHRHRH